MRSLWKKIHGLDFLGYIAKFFQYGEVPSKCCRVAGDVDDALWSHICEGAEDSLTAAGTRRVDDDDIRANALLVESGHDGGRVAYNELGVLYMIVPCIFPCVEDGGLYDLDAVDLSCPLCQK